eukprot:jgi/Mesvir1/863/Mv17434-RA.1
MGPCDDSAAVDLVLTVPGICAQILGAIPLLENVQLHRACRDFKSTVDESLDGTSEVLWEDIADVADGCRHRESLEVHRCSNIRLAAVTYLVTHCPRLQRLDVAHLNDEVILAL